MVYFNSFPKSPDGKSPIVSPAGTDLSFNRLSDYNDDALAFNEIPEARICNLKTFDYEIPIAIPHELSISIKKLKERRDHGKL